MAKTLTTASTNPYAQGGAGARAAPVALDVFSVQVCAASDCLHALCFIWCSTVVLSPCREEIIHCHVHYFCCKMLCVLSVTLHEAGMIDIDS